MRRRTTWLLLSGTAALAVAVAAAPGAATGRAAPGWQEPVLVDDLRASVETSLAINPRNEREMFLCDPSGVPSVLYGQSHFFRTVDGGRTWTYTDVETDATDTRGYAFEGGDCDVAYDAGGTIWTADTWVGNLSVGHSRDGVTWSGTAVAAGVPVVDRPWIVGGRPGELFVTYHDAQCCMPGVMWFTKTTDYGATWSPAVPVTTADQRGAFRWEGNLVVAPGGRELHVVYSHQPAPTVVRSGAAIRTTIALATSRDGGATWSSRDVTALPTKTSSIYPSVARNAGGHLHVVWAAPRENDDPVFYTTSRDGGATWTAPRALNPGKTGYAPWVAGGARGQARIVWLGSPQARNNPVAWYFYVAKIDAGRVRLGTTTRTPIWDKGHGSPEFEMVRLDSRGRMHIGMSVSATNSRWAVYYQRES